MLFSENTHTHTKSVSAFASLKIYLEKNTNSNKLW